jgi:hypothetical protein
VHVVNHYPIGISFDPRENFLNHIPNVTEEMIKQPDFVIKDSDNIIDHLGKLVKAHQEERLRLIARYREPMDDMLRLLPGISVLLIAIALALRITKVTVEVIKAESVRGVRHQT